MNNKLLLGVLTLLMLVMTSCGKEGMLSESMEETFYVRNDGSDMPVFVRGNGNSGKILLLLHGGPGDTSVSYMTSAYCQQLHDHYAVAYWDQRQQGNSHGHFDKEENSLSQIVEDAYHVVQSLKYRYGDEIEIYLWGHSWGGAVGTAYLQTDGYQEDIAGFIEVAGGFDFPRINTALRDKILAIAPTEISDGNNVDFWNEVLAFINDIEFDNITTEEALKLNSYAGRIEREMLPDDVYEIDSDRGYSEGAASVSNPIAVTTNALSIFVQEVLIDELLSLSLTDNLDKITIPTLLIWGEYDFKVPSDLGQLAFDRISSEDKTLHIYEHAGHTTMRYDADRFVDDVRAFVQ